MKSSHHEKANDIQGYELTEILRWGGEGGEALVGQHTDTGLLSEHSRFPQPHFPWDAPSWEQGWA